GRQVFPRRTTRYRSALTTIGGRVFRSIVRCAGLAACVGLGASRAEVTGSVFDDANGNGVRDPGERGLPGVVVSNQDTAVTTDASGAFRMLGSGTGTVFVSTPDGFRAVGPFWRTIAGGASLAFGLARATVNGLTFAHASDLHISPASVARTQRLRAVV